jgi:hypothetical protein
MVRVPLVDGPRGGFQPAVRRVLCVFLFVSLPIGLAVCFWLHKVWWTVREDSRDSLRGADGPRVEDGRSIIEGAVLVVWKRFLDGPPYPRVRSARRSRTVRLGFRSATKSFAP